MSDPKTRGDAARSPGGAAGSSVPSSGARVTPVADALREALATFAPGDRADEILLEALANGAFTGVPHDSAGLMQLVHVEIADVARRALGTDAAEAVVARLEPMIVSIARMEKAARPAPERDLASTRPVEVRAFRIVLIVGADPRDTTEIARTVRPPTSVIPVHDGRALASGLELLRDQPRMVLVDCRRSDAPLEPLVWLDPALLEGALVLLWGASEAQRRGTSERFPGAHVVECLHAMNARDIAVLVRAGPST